jgi:lipopolysaccharide export system protein LptA
MMRFLGLTFLSLFLWAISPAETMANPTSGLNDMMSDGELDVSADESLEWYQNEKMYVARGNARAVKGSMTIEADRLAAFEREITKPDSTEKVTEIYRLVAEGNVRVTTDQQQAFGDRAVYTLDEKVAVLTGKDLQFVTDTDFVTARDSLEYWEEKKIAVARGRAIAVRQDRHVEADSLTAEMAEGAKGDLEVVQMAAEGNVIIITKNDITYGDSAIYDLKANTALVKGRVRVTQEKSQLIGDTAEVDFKAGKSRLKGDGKTRVKALILREKKSSP